MGVAVFDYSRWIARYPEFVTVEEGLADEYFVEASFTLDNTDCSPVYDVDRRLILLNMLTAHIAALNGTFGPSGFVPGTPSGLVGRVSEATEGTVTVRTDMGATSQASAWYMQTPYGAAYWNATRGLRTARYNPGPRPNFEPLARGRW